MADLKSLTVEVLRTKINQSKRIGIIPHKNPDGDAIGSSLGLLHYLKDVQPDVTIVVEDQAPGFLSYLPGFDSLMIYDAIPEKASEFIKGCDVLFCLDYSQIKRAGQLESLIRESKALKIMIDHHPDPDEGFDFYQYDVTSSSTSELVYELIQLLQPGYSCSANLATCLYTGLMTDTGCFRHAIRPETLVVASNLLKAGISYEYIISKIFDSNTPEKIALIGFALNNKLQVLSEYRTCILSLSFEESERLGLKKGDTEGLVNYALSIENMVLGVFFHEKEKGKTKISFRSKGNFAVNTIASQYFSGGGHKNASGGEFIGTPEAAIKQLTDILPQYKAELTSLKIGERH